MNKAGAGRMSPSLSSPFSLKDPVEALDGIGPSRSALLGNLGILTMDDLLHHFPREY